MMRLLYPWMLWTLLVPLLLALIKRARRRPLSLRFSLASHSAAFASPSGRFWMGLPAALLFCALLCFCVAMARPQWSRSEVEVDREGVDIMLVLDTSDSMAALDFKLDGQATDRLTVVKKVVTDFIRKQSQDRLGMIVFGEHAYTQCPLTLDHDVLIQFLDHIAIGIAGEATAIGDGLALAVKRLKDLPGKSKVIILLTDGRNNAGKVAPEKAAELARTFKIKVYTIGIGTQGAVPFPRPGLFGNYLVYLNLEMDEETLKKIAQLTSGRYFYATDTQKLEEIYGEINRLEKTKATTKYYRHYDEMFPYFVVAGLVCMLSEFVLRRTWLRRAI